jgi:hypothetical protein
MAHRATENDKRPEGGHTTLVGQGPELFTQSAPNPSQTAAANRSAGAIAMRKVTQQWYKHRRSQT